MMNGDAPASADSSIRRSLRPSGRRERAQLLAAASEVFGLRGYYATVMEHVCEQARVSKPIVYAHFPGKLGLYLAVVEMHVDAWVGGVRKALRSATDSERRMRAATSATFDFVDRRPRSYRLVFDSDAGGEPPVRRRLARSTEDCVDAVCEAMNREGNDFRARMVATGLVGAWQAAATDWVESGRPVAKADAVEATVAMCWRGLARMPVHPSPRGS